VTVGDRFLKRPQAVPQKRTYFDDIGRGPRHHDRLVTGRCGSGKLVVGVERKADENFGESRGRT